jgi:hypothetical protein
VKTKTRVDRVLELLRWWPAANSGNFRNRHRFVAEEQVDRILEGEKKMKQAPAAGVVETENGLRRRWPHILLPKYYLNNYFFKLNMYLKARHEKLFKKYGTLTEYI